MAKIERAHSTSPTRNKQCQTIAEKDSETKASARGKRSTEVQRSSLERNLKLKRFFLALHQYQEEPSPSYEPVVEKRC